MEQQIVFITGTNSGFGLLTTLHLAQNGYYVIATMRNVDNKSELLAKAAERGIEKNIEILQLDVTNPYDIQRVSTNIENKYGKVDILINNAGYCLGGFSELVDINEWKMQFETNFFGVIAITQAILPMMRKRKSGKIINIGSISGRFGFPGLAPYVSSKHALEGFTESLRLELLPFSIHVSIIEAGSYQTNIWEKALNNQTFTEHEDYEEMMQVIYDEAQCSAKNAADPMEVCHTISKICRSPKPKLRYPVGRGIAFMILLKNIVPWSFIEKMVLKKLQDNGGKDENRTDRT